MKTPASLGYWMITAIAVIWASFGAIDYLLTQYKNLWYLGHFSEDQVTYYTSMPIVTQAAWGIAVWSVVLGALLLLLRERKAVLPLALGFFGYFIAVVWLAYVTEPSFYTVSGQIGAIILWGSVGMNLALWLVARRYRKVGVID